MKTQAQRNADYERVRRELGVDHIGLGADAKPLPPWSGDTARKAGAALPIEAAMHGAQMYEYGEIWPRPALDYRTRSFITVAAVAAQGYPKQLYRYINIALNVGITPDEIHETLLHATSYCGLPAWESSVEVATEVFVARGILPPGPGVTVEPKPPMDEQERRAAFKRVTAGLGVGRVGLGPDAPILKALPGGPVLATKPGSLGEEIAFINADYGYGELWGREGLPLRIRSFITCAVLHVMVENHQLHIHINNAVNIGISPEEMQEALLQVAVYHGGSGWHNAVTVARHVFEQHAALDGQAAAA